MTRILVLANGDGRRWNDTRGRPFLDRAKQFVVVDGETLLARTVRLFADRGADVVVIGPDESYRCPDAALATPAAPINECGSDMGKFLDTVEWWSPTGRTVIVWGDCYYTDDLIDQVTSHTDLGYHVWRRPARSEVTGARWDESFAVSFGPDDHARVIAAAETIAGHVRTGALRSSHIRTHLAAMAGYTDPADLDDRDVAANCPNQTHIDDWSDDFDSPREWREWMRRRFAHDGHRVGVCIPWSEGDTWRTSSYKWCREWWDRIPGVDVFIGTDRTGGEHPNRSAMRNDAARQAIDAGCDVLFMADSDTFVDPEQFWAAVALAVHQQQLVFAFDRYVRVTRPTTQRLMRHALDINDRSARFLRRRAYLSDSHISGALAIPATVWKAIGGYDERFVRWGYEDRAFHLAASIVAGEAPRVPGDAYHWWHPPAADKDREAPDSVDAARLARRYYLAAGWVPTSGAVATAIDAGLVAPIPDDLTADLDAMIRLLTEPDGPLALVQGGT